MIWNDLSDYEKHYTIKSMLQMGGGFVSALAEAWSRADSYNCARLEAAFPDMVERYGPESSLYLGERS